VCPVLLVLAFLLQGCGGASREGAKRASLVSIPVPDLVSATDEVREQLRAQQNELDRLLEGDLSSAELVEAFGDLGLLYITYSFLDAAEVCFANAERLVPEDHRWPYLLGYIFEIQGRLEEAERVLVRAAGLDPADAPTLIRLGRVRLEQGRYEEARAHFEGVLAIDSGSAAGIDGLGKAAAGLGDHSGAVEYFERALELQPTASSVHYALGLAYRRLGDLELARKNLDEGGDGAVLFVDPLLQPVAQLGRSAELYLVRGAQAFAIERWEEAAAHYREALAIEPENFTTYKALGFCLQKLGDLDGAIDLLFEAIQTGASTDPARDRLEHSEIYRILGGLTALQGRAGKATELFQTSLELNPDRPDVLSKLANALSRQGRFEEALPHYNRALELIPDHTEFLVQRATALTNLRRSREALSDFRRAVELEPENALVRQQFAEVLEFLGDDGAARREREAAIRLAKQGGGQVDILFREALALVRRGELEPAVGKFGEILEIEPGHTDARFQLASVLGHQGHLDQALAEFEQVISEAPLLRSARRAEITILLLQGRYGDARVRLNRALEALPRDRQLAMAFVHLLAAAPDARVRDGRLALEVAQRIYAAGPADPQVVETLAMAYAEAGQVAKAVELQRQLLEQVSAAGNGGLVNRVKLRLAAYEQGSAWRATSPREIIEANLAADAAGNAEPGSMSGT